jgi:hypothetical protein
MKRNYPSNMGIQAETTEQKERHRRYGSSNALLKVGYLAGMPANELKHAKYRHTRLAWQEIADTTRPPPLL